ncbi:S26 family signal peptidase [Comamonas endophytica]|uniref:S26 family signal peptidase n=1 Tax=Comamonas endophytica TaxID=2949090 RepID=A0ABY6GHJ8_9BURK|nr:MULTISPECIES: S26 family signal peptidase [unclassified Acidovorax]MCD2514644.1 S26 family signal peptidase [Acidovorax sp. D4N7]UYG53957.1 S26 family signal peptidase [Acidovorax sp. 5MLIR]
MKTGKSFAIWALSLTGLVAAFAVGGRATGLRINATASAPTGLWMVKKVGIDRLGRRRLVEICPPAAPVVDWMRDRGYLAAGGCDMQVAPLLKPIQAIAGDVVRLQPGRPAVVNGRELQNTRALPFMRAYPAGEYQVGPGEVWVFSSYSDGSFDSRYFGPVPLSRVRGIATPLWVSGSTAALSSGGAQ